MTAFWVCLAIWAVVALAFFCFLDLEYDYESRVGISVFWPVFLVFCAGVGIGWLFKRFRNPKYPLTTYDRDTLWNWVWGVVYGMTLSRFSIYDSFKAFVVHVSLIAGMFFITLYVGRKLKLRRLALQKAKNAEKLAMSQQWLEAQLQKINEQGLGQHATGKLMGYAEKKTYYDMGSEWDIDYIGPPPSSPPPHDMLPADWFNETETFSGSPPSKPFLSVDIESKT